MIVILSRLKWLCVYLLLSVVLVVVGHYSRDRGIMRLCARIILCIIGDLPHNWAKPA